MAIGTLPFLILNYGAEMIFILNARLIAQKVKIDTARAVMNDIVWNMFNPEFLDEIFRPQSIYSPTQTKELFMSIAQTSIMQLSSASMSKLFELMTMGLKYQIFTLRHPLELIELMWNHLEEVQRIITPEAQQHLIPVFTRLERLFHPLNASDFAEIRKEILNFFLGRNTSVSVLLDEGLQAPTGFFYISKDTIIPPLAACEPPGSIRYYNNNQFLHSTNFNHRDSGLRYPALIPPGTWDQRNASKRITKNGLNLYAVKSGNLPERAWATTNINTTTTTTTTTSSSSSGGKTESTFTSVIPLETTKAVTGELNYLSHLIGGVGSQQQHQQQQQQEQMFKLSLFDDPNEDKDEEYDNTMKTGDKVTPAVISVNRMTKRDVQTQNKELIRIMDDLRLSTKTTLTTTIGENSSKTGNDLLDIMDED